MLKSLIIICTLLYVTIKTVNTQNVPQSPCPDTFEYRYDGQQWFGSLVVPSPVLGETLMLHLHMSLRAQLPTVSRNCLNNV